MQYFVLFLEGLTTFISPCLLPMIPLYITYFAGDPTRDGSKRRTVINTLGFIAGFTFIFVSLGAFAGFLGVLLKQYQSIINIISGGVIILFGLNYIGVLQISFLNQTRQKKTHKIQGFFSALLFGAVFSISWTPCISTFLSSALAIASQHGSMMKGILLLLSYSMGLGLPFLLSAVLIDELKSTFTFIKKHYQIINFISGLFLIIIGILMMTGILSRYLSLLTF